FVIAVFDLVRHRQTGATQRTAQIIDSCTGRTITCSQNSNHRQDGGITGHRPVDHVTEDSCYLFVEHKIGTRLRRSENSVLALIVLAAVAHAVCSLYPAARRA